MSTITFIVVKDGKLRLQDMHYRAAINVMSAFDHFSFDSNPVKILDEGYILLDLDSEIIVNNQLGFSFHDLPERIQKKIYNTWDVVE